MSDSPRQILEAQLRECFGRVVYTHKTHEKQADILHERRHHLNLTQIVLSAIATGGFVASLFGKGPVGTAIGSVVSLALLVLNAYAKDHDLGALAQQHKQTASKLWVVREKYFSLLTDSRIGESNLEDLMKRRDELMADLQEVQDGAPITTAKAYARAQRALQHQGDLTFSDEEIDAFLPRSLKSAGSGTGSAD